MLNRRVFLGCALCAAAGFSANDAGAQGLKRTILKRMDGPAPGYETIEARVEIDPNALIARHTHFGLETSYVIEGSVDLTIEGDGGSTKTYGPGEGFQVPAGAIHGGKSGEKSVTLLGVYVVEKGKPLAAAA